jgi:putative oxidoreductase
MNDNARDVAALVGRLLMAALFLLEGWSKLRGYDAAVAYMQRYGVPALLLPATIAVEIGGGLALALGWQSRTAALILAAFCIAAAVIFHTNFADRGQVLHFEKDLAIAGGLLALAALGPGRYAVRAFRQP